ncbi:MAG: hypothetical protein GEU79_09245 [Acidimicrobiia bacterium]|nr:hypothetical protein [Acidimicrobiia bacterium]
MVDTWGRRVRIPRLRILLGLGVVIVLIGACSQVSPPIAHSSTAQVSTHLPKVILISVDGLNPDVIARMGETRLPNFHRLRAEGASTHNARTMVELTSTLPNHSSMFTGWNIGDHEVTFNRDNGATIHQSAGIQVSSIFTVAHDNGLSTALYAGKPKFDFYDRSWNEDFAEPDVTGTDDGPDKIDDYQRASGGVTTRDYVTKLGEEGFGISVVHYAEVDDAGHDHGSGSPEYRGAIADVDAWIGDILNVVEADRDLAENTVLVVTADHGTSGTSHGDPGDPDNYTILFYIWGTGIPHADLYTLAEGSRTDPGTRQPLNGEAEQPIRNGDVANLILDLIHLGPVPGSTINTEQDLLGG